jgi:hypothetical protein
MYDISFNVDIYEREGSWWMTISGELFGPYESDEEAVNNLPDAVRHVGSME